MAQEIVQVHQIRSGIPSEYYGSIDVSANNDSLLMSFEGEFNIDNIVLHVEANSQFSIDLNIIYPSSEKSLNLLNGLYVSGSSPSTWSLNARYSSFGQADTGKLWYNIPSGSSLKCEISGYTSYPGKVTLLAVGV